MSLNISNFARQSVVALFATRADADQGVTRLLSQGFLPNDIGLVQPADAPKDPTRGQSVPTAVGAFLGAAAGAGLGALLVGMESMGLAVVAIVMGVLFGAYVGSTLGAFFETAGPDGDDPYFVRAIRGGSFLVSADVTGVEAVKVAAAVLHECHALEVNTLEAGRLDLRFGHPVPTEEAA